MTDSSGEWITTAKTFRFTSGQILTLDEDQIEKIPYLAAIVSSGNSFESLRDEDGHYKLDPHIEYKHFSFVLESLSFHSVRQLFTRVPEHNDIIPIIALLDFLGIGPQPDPTLNEVDSTFFSNLVYSPMLEKYVQIIHPSIIQDMAVRLSIAMAKEEYDFTKHKIINQIYWFIMFILSAYKLFHIRIRYHVYKIAEHCFSLFRPSLLKPLKKLMRRTNIDARKLILITNEENSDPDKENDCPLEQILHFCDSDNIYIFRPTPTLKQRQELLQYRLYKDQSDFFGFWHRQTSNEETLLKPVCKRVLEIMYARLQSEICQCAVAKIRSEPSSHIFVREKSRLWFNFDLFELDSLPEDLDDILGSEIVQLEILERILEEICVLITKLDKKHVELVKEIQEYDQNRDASFLNVWFFFDYYRPGVSRFEYIQEEALTYELTLEKLHERSIVLAEIRQRVLNELRNVARKQFIQWKRTHQDIDELRHQLSNCQQVKKSSITSKDTHPRYRVPVNKSLPKLQIKYSAR